MRYLNLTDAEQVVLHTLVACFAFLVVVLTCSACMAMSIKVDPAILWALFGPICAFAGIGAAQFAQLRKTDYGFVEREGEAKAKIAAATQTPPVVTPPAPAVEIHS